MSSHIQTALGKWRRVTKAIEIAFNTNQGLKTAIFTCLLTTRCKKGRLFNFV